MAGFLCGDSGCTCLDDCIDLCDSDGLILHMCLKHRPERGLRWCLGNDLGFRDFAEVLLASFFTDPFHMSIELRYLVCSSAFSSLVVGVSHQCREKKSHQMNGHSDRHWT